MYQPIYSKWLLITMLIITSFHASAATFCVSNTVELINSLITAESNGEADEIKLKIGTFVIPFEQSFNYSAPDTETFGLKISGGWVGFFNSPCAFPTISNSTIDGNFGDRAFHISPKGSQTVEISGLTFINGEIIGENGGGLNIDAPTPSGFIPVGFSGTIIVENNAFISNQADSGSALSITGANKIIVRNNLIVENLATVNSAVTLDNRSERGIYFTNNTVLNNTTDGISSIVAAVTIYTQGTSQGFIANNVLWNDNGVLDLYFADFENSGDYFLYNNDIGSYLGFSLNEANNISTAPEFQPGIDNFTPEYNGNLFDQGNHPPVLVHIPPWFEEQWTLGFNDTFGADRVVSVAVDIGAIENPGDTIFEDGFEGEPD